MINMPECKERNLCMLSKERIGELIAELTLDEKLSMIHGNGMFETAGVERLNIPPLIFSDGPMGVRLEFEKDSWEKKDLSDDYVTYLPCNSALAATFNRDLAYETGRRIYASVSECDWCCLVEDLEQAVATAKRLTPAGRACVLSPAAASYGYFKDFEERGEVFRALVGV